MIIWSTPRNCEQVGGPFVLVPSAALRKSILTAERQLLVGYRRYVMVKAAVCFDSPALVG